MRKDILLALCMGASLPAMAQETQVNLSVKDQVTIVKNNKATPVKSQDMTGTCWCFSTTSLIESECMRKGQEQPDISEMFSVRNIYREKAENYILRQGYARFDEGGLGHDVIRAIARYGVVPESVYSGLKDGQTAHNHGKLVSTLKTYLDSVLKLKKPIPANWEDGVDQILDNALGKAPANFEYNGKSYTPQTYAKDVLKFTESDYVNLTSFTHHPFYQPFVVEVPDNFSNGAYYNLPLAEFVDAVKQSIGKGYTIMWDADVSNRGFKMEKGYALSPAGDSIPAATGFKPGMAEVQVTPAYRQQLFESLVTQDDHLMHITGLGKGDGGKDYFIVKNSWGTKTPKEGYIYVSEPYFAVNTVTVIVPKSSLDKALLTKLGIK
ncbi:aminopeptidase [Chitinophaga horti]|uniref:Aminopeptidase n=1 Tax=Chitinophaga horti TaxID=2920382 RepID=A0ABY6J6Q0_9BACT|nr:C1 family peptidase [Chitinophaga horti]UYQ94282.1 aminopeptidase [Chitinophaga horti]